MNNTRKIWIAYDSQKPIVSAFSKKQLFNSFLSLFSEKIEREYNKEMLTTLKELLSMAAPRRTKYGKLVADDFNIIVEVKPKGKKITVTLKDRDYDFSETYFFEEVSLVEKVGHKKKWYSPTQIRERALKKEANFARLNAKK